MADLDRAKAELPVFADLIGCPLEAWQAQSLRMEARTTAIVAPRQAGKSRSLGVLAVWWAFRQREQRVLIVSGGGEAGAYRLLAEIRRLVAGSELLAGSVVDEQAGLVRLSNGSEVRSVPASERQVRGWTVDLLLVDEAALVPDDLLLGAALPTTAARPQARIVLASSANVAGGAFYDFVRTGEAGSEHVRTHRWALADCWWISPSAVEAARAAMSPLRFAAEYEGVFASGADALFTRGALERATADFLPTPLGELRGPARLLGGVDWGASVDSSAVCAVARLPLGGERIFAVACAHRWPAGEPLPNVLDALVGCPAHWDTLAAETNGLGLPLAQELARRLVERAADRGGGRRPPRTVVVDEEDFDAVVGRRSSAVPAQRAQDGWRTRRLLVHTTAEMKAATYSTLRLLIENGRLVLPASATELLRELLLLRVDLNPGGGERIEASRGHDDLADAIMLACCPFRDRDGRWSSLLGYYADPRRALPAPAVDFAGVEQAMVSTGAGLMVPRVPILQSVRGREVTVPVGVDLTPRRVVSPALRAMRAAVRDGVQAQPTPSPIGGIEP